LFQLLDEAVQFRLASDVPLGSFLSGGLDSSIISGLASKQLKHLPTFSLGFSDDHFFDETKDAIAVAKHFNTEHTAFTLSRNDLHEALFEVLDYLDEPFGDSSALPFYILSKLTRQKVKVALSGDGADEVFGGYVKHNGEFRARNPGLPELAVSAIQPLLNLFPASRNNQFMNSLRRLQRFAEGMKLDEQERYWRWCTIATANEAMELLLNKPPLQEFLNRKNELTSFIHKNGDLNEVLLNDMHLVLPNDMLHKADAMSMANGLEVRSPFLDYRVVAFAFSLPAAYKADSHHRKMIVHDAFRKMLPASLYHRPKHGFEIPLHGFLTTELRTLLDQYLGKDFIQEQKLFSYPAIALLKQQLFSSNPSDSAARVWGLIVFQHWWKRNFAGQSKTIQASIYNQ
jgi:asparagine synthase (glutamine-hydrolysing)